MKKTLTLLALTAALMPMIPLEANGELITVNGVKFEREGDWSTATGWFDACKSWDGDSQLCWAATSSNLIAWWQSQNPDYQEDGDPWGVDAVWNVYKNTFENDSGIISKGVKWWFDGTGTGSTSADLQYKDGHISNGGYYKEHLYGGVVEYATPANITTLYSESYNKASSLASTLVGYMRSGYAVGLNFISGQQGHAETLWGIEYDPETQLITRMYISDSDDSLKPGIRTLSIGVLDHGAYQTFYQNDAQKIWEVESFVLLSPTITNDIARLNTYDEDSSTVTLRQNPGNGGYKLPEGVKEIFEVVYDNSRNVETAGSEKLIGRQLTVDAAHDGTHVQTIQVDATQGMNLLEVQKGVTLTAENVVGSGLLTKTGDGTLKLTDKDGSGKIDVQQGVLECGNGTLAEITLTGSKLQGGGKFNKVTVNDSTLAVGNAPDYQQYSGGSLTLSQATLEFYIDGFTKEASKWNGIGWGSGTYSNLDMSGGSIYVMNTESIDEMNFYLGGSALEALLQDGSFTLGLITGIQNSYFMPDYEDLVANTHFYVSDAAEAIAGTSWLGGEDLTNHFSVKYEYVQSYDWGPWQVNMVGTYTGVTPPIPEPSTSTLSLLTLASLCARRRRK